MVVNLYPLTNALQTWTSIKPGAPGKSCSHTMRTKEAACENTGATFSLCAADMNYVQAIDLIILNHVRTTSVSQDTDYSY